ncbi:MAG: hypothetical protein KGL59_07140 [Acidobacteriota bacterium]|nr:hypothetical protein [Acidobacteriota bacterium]
MTRLRLFALAAAAALALALSLAAATPSLNLSGYEFLLGTSCTFPGGQTGKCGVEFGGWTGGSGQNADGWTPFPGDRKGLWEATVNYIGSPNFGDSVQVVSGTFDVLFKNRKTISGTVTGGTVEWPAEGQPSACGVNVATVYLNLSSGAGGPTTFQGCLHDLPAGTVIPPKIWGTLQ